MTSSSDNHLYLLKGLELSDGGEYDSAQEEKQPVPTYSDMLLTG